MKYNTLSLSLFNILLTTLIIISLIAGNYSFGQSKTEIQNVDFTLRNDSLFITYDLAKASKNEQFLISLTIITASGKTIHPQSVSGDVGNNVTGGKGKKIIWEINRDNIFINEGISVEVNAQPQGEYKMVHRGAAVALSAIVPGLGITKLNRGGLYWIMAIGFYGAAAGSYIYYNSAEKNYNKYLDCMVEDERNNYYDKVQSQNTISDVLMYTAGAIWVGNMIWTLACPNKTKPAKGMSFNGGYDPTAKVPLFKLTYNF